MSEVKIGSVLADTMQNITLTTRRAFLWLALLFVMLMLSSYLGDAVRGWLNSLPYVLSLIAASVLGAAIYRALLGKRAQTGLLLDAFQLFLASLLVLLVLAIVAFIVGLTLVIMSAVLVVASGYDPSGADAQEVAGSIAALEASGAIWLLYAGIGASIAILVWFLVRLILFGAATVARCKVIVFQSWATTKHSACKITLLAILVLAPPIVLLLIAENALSSGLVAKGVAALLGTLIVLIWHALAASLYRQLVQNS